METTTSEIADDVFRISTYVPEADFMFNQFLVRADEPLLFHTGPRRMFPLVSQAVAGVVPVDQVRWITFGHVEGDECGSMNDWLAIAPAATVAHTAVGCMVQVDDLADRPPRPLQPDEVLDLGGKRVRHIATPHVPHGWDAGLLFEETTGTLLCGDLFSATGSERADHERRHPRARTRSRGPIRRHVPHGSDRAHDPGARGSRAAATGRHARPLVRRRLRRRFVRTGRRLRTAPRCEPGGRGMIAACPATPTASS